LPVTNVPEFGFTDDMFVDWIGSLNKVEARVVDSFSCGK
jgi:hypothetical protein